MVVFINEKLFAIGTNKGLGKKNSVFFILLYDFWFQFSRRVYVKFAEKNVNFFWVFDLGSGGLNYSAAEW